MVTFKSTMDKVFVDRCGKQYNISETEEDINKWKNKPCSWIGIINIIKVFILLKAI